MKHFLTIVIFALFLQFNATAQYTEAGIFAGVSNYQGDLSRNATMEISEYAAAFGAFGRYNFNGHFAAKVHFYKGVLQGGDYHAQGQRQTGRRARNLSFRSDLYELGLQFEYNFLDFNIAIRDHITTPYVFAGVAGIYFNPQAEIDGQWHDLQPLGTEGQGLEGNPDFYSLFNLAIPMGVGVKFNLNHLTNIGLELGMRKTFSDHLDDVSADYYPDIKELSEARGEVAAALAYRTLEFDPTRVDDLSLLERGNPDNKDWYFFGGVTISVNIGKASGFDKKQKQPTRRQKKAPKMEF